MWFIDSFNELFKITCQHKYVKETMKYGGIRYRCSKCCKIKWF